MSTTLNPIIESAILAGDAPAFRNAIRHGGPLPDFAMSTPVSVGKRNYDMQPTDLVRETAVSPGTALPPEERFPTAAGPVSPSLADQAL